MTASPDWLLWPAQTHRRLSAVGKSPETQGDRSEPSLTGACARMGEGEVWHQLLLQGTWVAEMWEGQRPLEVQPGGRQRWGGKNAQLLCEQQVIPGECSRGDLGGGRGLQMAAPFSLNPSALGSETSQAGEGSSRDIR